MIWKTVERAATDATSVHHVVEITDETPDNDETIMDWLRTIKLDALEEVIDELKSMSKLDEMSVRREEAVKCFMMTALLVVLVSRYLLRQVRARFGPASQQSVEEKDRVEPVKFSKQIQLFSGDLLRVLSEQLGYGWDGVGFVIVEGAIDPNVDRHALTERVAHGSVDPNLRNAGELATIRPG